MRVIFNPDLTVIPCEIMANSHAFCKTSYDGVGATMHYNMTGNIIYIDAEGHGACFSNTWLFPESAAHKDQSAQASKQTNLMANFLDKAGKNTGKRPPSGKTCVVGVIGEQCSA